VPETEVVALHSPQDCQAGQVVSLAKLGKVWRKQILPLGSINYEGRQIRFDSEYHKQLVRNFRAGAYPQVPFQLADKDNAHTNDPERTRGELVDLRAEESGLYGYFKVTKPELLLNNQNLGVSCRIVENYARESDGKFFGHSLQHVLGTLDPRVTGMRPWESVELASAVASETVDLAATVWPEPDKDGAEMPDAKEDKHVVELSTAQLDKLNRLLDEEDTEGDELELDPEMFADGEDEEDEGPDDYVELDEGGDDDVVLATVNSLQRQVLELTNTIEDRDNAFEIKQLAATGLAPSIIEAARPLLALGSGVVELANGSTVSPAGQTRTLLRAILELSQRGYATVELDREDGFTIGGDSQETLRQQQVDQMDKLYGTN
jgi:hypothetical protein